MIGKVMKQKIGKALVVGAGISGIRSALDLAEYGYKVTVIDRAAYSGGILSQLDNQFPTNHCGMCRMLPLVQRDEGTQACLRKGLRHQNIDLLLSTELASVSGEPGKFEVTLRRKAGRVDPHLCLGCGRCSDVCPVDVPDAFNAGLSVHKAIYQPLPHAVPSPFVIDESACTRCGACVPVCPTKAIELVDKDRGDFRVLVVDDELIVRDSLKEWLEDEGFSAEMAASGQEALDKMTEKTFNLMLLDIKMPGMDGVEVLRRAKEIQPELTVIMMTAYATVDTAVEAMKIGALDYLVKPFDVDDLAPKVLGLYQQCLDAAGPRLEVGAIVLAGGVDYFNPAEGVNRYGYGLLPGVVTNIEFERIISGSGPCQGKLVRPDDGRPVKKIAWLQCVGSRDIQAEADFCSSYCCMAAIKEAELAKTQAGPDVETTIFYMDMRTFNRDFQRYRERSESEYGVRYKRVRAHTVDRDPESGDLLIGYLSESEELCRENFDMVVLSLGQRPPAGMAELSEKLDIELNPWGFPKNQPLSPGDSSRTGIYLAGSASGLKDISESVIHAGAAALGASKTIHHHGGSLAVEESGPAVRDVSREPTQILAAMCTCGDTLSSMYDSRRLDERLEGDVDVARAFRVSQACSENGFQEIIDTAVHRQPNRILIGACLPLACQDRVKELARRAGLDPALVEVVDVRSPAVYEDRDDGRQAAALMESNVKMGLAKLRRANPKRRVRMPVIRRALVIGGGIAGLTAALSIADHGFEVDLVEKTDTLGGNLKWLTMNLDGSSLPDLLEETLGRLEKHPQVTVHTRTTVMAVAGQAGNFHTTITREDQGVENLRHGVIILATGGGEAPVEAYAHDGETVMTQRAFEEGLTGQKIDPKGLNTVVMIQCAGTREDPRNYCSRVCCPTALKHALYLKSQNPQVKIFIFYRDMMTPGFTETWFTQARQAGVIFVQYDKERKPGVKPGEKGVEVTAFDPVLGREVAIQADLAVLAAGVSPHPLADAAGGLDIEVNQDGFFREAESKWRPVDAMQEGVFACGLALSPRSTADSKATAEAAAARALRILSREYLEEAAVTAQVREALCSLCERCIEACPYGARSLDIDRTKVTVNPAMCQGCGSCAAICPNGASVLAGFYDQQVFETIDAAMEGFWG